ncbi:MAG: hypothetical protein HY420_00415 [Candidatus Kerfeldbacteria bacterium]|nr:hypothetical protein [Candidatus Kerfeldbacteria bacterium]
MKLRIEKALYQALADTTTNSAARQSSTTVSGAKNGTGSIAAFCFGRDDSLQLLD